MLHWLMLWIVLPFALTTIVLVGLALGQAWITETSALGPKRK